MSILRKRERKIIPKNHYVIQNLFKARNKTKSKMRKLSMVLNADKYYEKIEVLMH